LSAFADSSALVKLYTYEHGSEVVRAEAALAVCALARVEVPAAIWRKHRIGDISAEEAAGLAAGFANDYGGDEHRPPRFAAMEVTSSLLEDASRFPALHGLRAYDSVQLAAALAAATADPSLARFLCFDTRLRAAAAAHGLTPVP
jgi:predicted nucleic acid-binding protein